VAAPNYRQALQCFGGRVAKEVAVGPRRVDAVLHRPNSQSITFEFKVGDGSSQEVWQGIAYASYGRRDGVSDRPASDRVHYPALFVLMNSQHGLILDPRGEQLAVITTASGTLFSAVDAIAVACCIADGEHLTFTDSDEADILLCAKVLWVRRRGSSASAASSRGSSDTDDAGDGRGGGPRRGSGSGTGSRGDSTDRGGGGGGAATTDGQAHAGAGRPVDSSGCSGGGGGGVGSALMASWQARWGTEGVNDENDGGWDGVHFRDSPFLASLARALPRGGKEMRAPVVAAAAPRVAGWGGEGL